MYRCFNSILLLGIPCNWGIIAKDINTSIRTLHHSITCMIGIDKRMYSNFLSSWLRHIQWDSFLGTTIKIFPLVFYKPVLSNNGHAWIKNKIMSF
jgi:hypothetical protein